MQANPLGRAVADHVQQSSDDLHMALSHVNWDWPALAFALCVLTVQLAVRDCWIAVAAVSERRAFAPEQTCVFLVDPSGFGSKEIYFTGSTAAQRMAWQACVT